MIINRHNSASSAHRPIVYKSRHNSLAYNRNIKCSEMTPPKPLSHAKLNTPRRRPDIIIPKLEESSNSVKNFEVCTNKLLRAYTRLGPNISFSAISSVNKQSHYKILGAGGGITLAAITRRYSLMKSAKSSGRQRSTTPNIDENRPLSTAH